MNTKEFLADDRWLSAETKAGREHPDPKIKTILSHHAIRRRVRCKDGFNVSIQWSKFHYCNARERIMGGEWDGGLLPEPTSVELGFPSKGDPLLTPYAEEPRKVRKTVYAWVPIEVVDEVLAKHGGIVAVMKDDHAGWEKVDG